jgi:hypothetical protein
MCALVAFRQGRSRRALSPSFKLLRALAPALSLFTHTHTHKRPPRLHTQQPRALTLSPKTHSATRRKHNTHTTTPQPPLVSLEGEEPSLFFSLARALAARTRDGRAWACSQPRQNRRRHAATPLRALHAARARRTRTAFAEGRSFFALPLLMRSRFLSLPLSTSHQQVAHHADFRQDADGQDHHARGEEREKSCEGAGARREREEELSGNDPSFLSAPGPPRAPL